MNDAEIREAVNYFNGDLRADDVTEIHQKPLVALATRYLELGGVVEEKDDSGYLPKNYEEEMFHLGRHRGYNQGRQDTLLAIEKRLEGLGEIIKNTIIKETYTNSSGRWERIKGLELLEEAIRESILGKEGGE